MAIRKRGSLGLFVFSFNLIIAHYYVDRPIDVTDDLQEDVLVTDSDNEPEVKHDKGT